MCGNKFLDILNIYAKFYFGKIQMSPKRFTAAHLEYFPFLVNRFSHSDISSYFKFTKGNASLEWRIFCTGFSITASYLALHRVYKSRVKWLLIPGIWLRATRTRPLFHGPISGPSGWGRHRWSMRTSTGMEKSNLDLTV